MLEKMLNSKLPLCYPIFLVKLGHCTLKLKVFKSDFTFYHSLINLQNLKLSINH